MSKDVEPIKQEEYNLKRYILPLILWIFCANASVVSEGKFEPALKLESSAVSIPAFSDVEAYADLDASEYVDLMSKSIDTVYVHKDTKKAANILAQTYKAAGRIGADNLALWATIAGKRTNLSPRLLLSLACHESSCDPKKRSRKGARGMMQIMQLWGDTPRELSDYRFSLVRGAEILAYYRDNVCNGGLRCALQVYNVGEGNYANGMRNMRYVNAVAGILRSVGGRI
jgi:soluble lytic murein transglycosylase-like protein